MLPSKVLVVRLGAIGDVVNALVFATALKEHAPDVQLGWAVHDLALPLIEGHPAVDRVHHWRRGGGVRGFWALVREVRAERYELAVDLQRLTKSSLLARLSGAKRVLGYDRARAKEHSWIWTNERIPPADPTTHMVEQYLEFARYLGAADEGSAARHAFPPDPEADAWAEELVTELGGAPLIVNLGATKPANRWLPERFGELAARCARDHPVCLTGGPADRGTARAALVAAATTGAGEVRDLVGQTSLRQLIALTARARLVVGCDTGPMHIAVACGTPVVALFGPADPARTGPYRHESAVVRVPPPCSPCNLRHCNQPRHACMEDITVELVLDAIAARLSGPSAAR